MDYLTLKLRGSKSVEEGVRDELHINLEQPLGLGRTQEWGLGVDNTLGDISC